MFNSVKQSMLVALMLISENQSVVVTVILTAVNQSMLLALMLTKNMPYHRNYVPTSQGHFGYPTNLIYI